MAAAQTLTYHKGKSLCETRGSLNASLEAPVHTLVKLLNSRKCHYFCHNYGSRRSHNLSTMLSVDFVICQYVNQHSVIARTFKVLLRK